MAVNDNGSREQYIVQSGETTFEYPFEIFVAADIQVYLTKISDPLNPILLSYPTDYTLTGIGALNGGEVEVIYPLAVGDILTLQRDVIKDRVPAFDFSNGEAFEPPKLNINFDKMFILIQQFSDLLHNRGLLYGVTDQLDSGQTTLPRLGADQFWKANIDENLIAASCSDNDGCSTLRSELANNSDGTDGSRLVGYYDEKWGASTIHDVITNLESELPPFPDNQALIKNSVDQTKLVNIDATNISTGEFRTITMPDEDVFLGQATTDTKGLVSIATVVEAKAGTDNTKMITPLTLKQVIGDTAMVVAYIKMNLTEVIGAYNLTLVSQETGIYTYNFINAIYGTNYVVRPFLDDISYAGQEKLIYTNFMSENGFIIHTILNLFLANISHNVLVYAHTP